MTFEAEAGEAMTGNLLVERLRSEAVNWSATCGDLFDEAADEIERLRAALQQIVDEADSDNGLTAWDGGDIARAALVKPERSV